MKVVVDTSTFIRATFEEDKTAWETLKKVMTGFEVVSTNEMAEELLTAIHFASKRKEKDPLKTLEMAAKFLLRAVKIVPKTKFPWCNDPTDAMFIECAIDGGAKVVISNDRSLIALREYVTDQEALEMIDGITFITPLDFLEEYGH